MQEAVLWLVQRAGQLAAVGGLMMDLLHDSCILLLLTLLLGTQAITFQVS